MSIVEDLIRRGDQLAADRAPWERVWREVADVCLPMASMARVGPSQSRYDRLIRGPQSADKGRKIYDSTSVWVVDRLSAGIETMVTPSATMWHGLSVDDPLREEPTDEENEWYDRVTRYLFGARYNAKSGFQTANQLGIKSTVSLGTSVLYAEENFGKGGTDGTSMPTLYRHLPLSENYLAVDAQGEVDTNFRRFSMTPRQMVQRWGDKVGTKIKTLAEATGQQDRERDILHAVMPRAERGTKRGSNQDAPWASYFVDVEDKHLIGEGGYWEFPFIVYHWQQAENSAYGESPVMLALADIKTLQAMGKSQLRASQLWVDPPLAVSTDGVTNRPNLNPRAINYGAVDENGRSKIVPILTGQNPGFAEQILEQKRGALRESLYINLFQSLLQNPGETATAALLRAQEKGELLGPAGAKIQGGLARLVDRELGIIERKGAYEEGSVLRPPASMAGKNIGVRFTAPIDKLRQAGEATGIIRTLELAAQLSSADPEIWDHVDTDYTIRKMREINGAPAEMLRRNNEIEGRREGRAQQQMAMQAMEQVKAAGEAGTAAAGGIAALAQAGSPA